jgi:hypothetical protein
LEIGDRQYDKGERRGFDFLQQVIGEIEKSYFKNGGL